MSVWYPFFRIVFFACVSFLCTHTLSTHPLKQTNKQADSLPYFDVIVATVNVRVHVFVCESHKLCIGCIQLYYTYVLKIARLKFNLSFKTNCLFLSRKLFHSFMYSWKSASQICENAARHDTTHVGLCAHCRKSWNFCFNSLFSLLLCLWKRESVHEPHFRWLTLHTPSRV